MMRKILLTLILAICHLGGVRAQDWTNIPVPADAGSGKTWELQANVSDDFNYNFNSSSHSNFGSGNKWYNFYHNTWDGPGYTYWKHSNVTVDGSDLVINVGYTSENSKGGSYGVVSGCVTSNAKVQYPVYVESAISVANISLASCFWLLSPDDTEEIDIIENYGGVNGYKHLTHISHHSFVRSPFTDYQPRDWNSWYPDSRVSTSYGWGDWCYNNGNRRYMRMGVYWISPKHFEYYIDGELVRVMYYNAIATKYNGTWQYTYFNSMNWNVNGYNLPTNNGSGYTDVTTHATSSTYNFATLQAASNASNGYNVIDPAWFQGGDDSDEDGNGVTVEARGFTKELDIIINMESQSWLAGSTPSASDLGNPAKNQMKVDWVRVYKPVQGSNHVAVTGVNLSPATLNLEVGDTGNVTGAVTPSNATDQTMTFTSSDTNVATVNQSGLVSAVSAGSATITATTTDGAFTDTSQITVTNPSSGGSGGAIVIEAENFGSTGGTYNDGFVPFGANNAGTKINYVNAGDWTEYAINVSSAGLYDLQYMISTPMTNAQVTLQVNGTSVATDNVPNNGQWDDYTSLNSATQVNLPAGAVTIRVLASGSNAWQWNLDKITLSESSSTPPPSNEVSLTIQAEDFASTGGTYNDGVVPFGANDNGSSINFVNGGDWMNYNVTIPEAGTYTVTYYISTPLSGTSIEMQVGSSYHMTTVPNNGGWESYQALQASATVYFAAGNHVVQLKGGASDWQWNLDRFTLYKPGSGARLRDEGVAQEISTINILAYPNPVSYALHLKGLPEGNYSLKMYNLSGSMVLNQEINYVNQFILDVNDLRNGMYVLRVRGGDIDTRLKVKVKH